MSAVICLDYCTRNRRALASSVMMLPADQVRHCPAPSRQAVNSGLMGRVAVEARRSKRTC